MPRCLALGLNDGQGSERAAVQVVGEMRGPLQQPRVDVENVAWKSFAARRTAQQQGQLAIGTRVVSEIVVNDEHVPARLHEMLRDAGRRVGSDVGEPRRVVAFGHDDDRVIHRAFFAQGGDNLGDGRARWPMAQ